MDAELDYNLTPDQWETLKALRIPVAQRRSVKGPVLEQLIALGLATASDDVYAISAWGRKVLIRGSARLWDVAA
jgi:hypothetical protein